MPEPQIIDAGPVEEVREIVRFWLVYAGQRIELSEGETLIGRSAACQIILDDGLVSRKHALLRVIHHRVELEDTGSANGVFLNDQRIRSVESLKNGDRIGIGQQELVLQSAVIRVPQQNRLTADTLHGPATQSLSQTRRELDSVHTINFQNESQVTDALELLGGVADKVLALGRGDEAERVLSKAMSNALAVALKGKLPRSSADRAAYYAARLAEATGKAKWVDYSVEMFTALRRPMPASAVDLLYGALRRIEGTNLTSLRAYVEVLRAAHDGFGPADRFLAQRIEGLERIAVLK